MDSNRISVLAEFEELKGQTILDIDTTYRFIGVAEDDNDYLYVLYNGRKISYATCLIRLIRLKGKIADKDYEHILHIARLNHYDQYKKANEEDEKSFGEYHREELLKDVRGIKFLTPICWDLN
jgi:hypothetical protein